MRITRLRNAWLGWAMVRGGKIDEGRLIIAIVFVAVVVWYGWHSTHNELTKKINRETDPEARRELIKLQGQIDRGRAGF